MALDLTTAGGTVAKTYRYDAYGNVMQETGPTINRGFTYTGRQYHTRSGLYYYRARWYSPQLGRFLTQDPIGFAGGINFYSYVENNPVNWIDPNGLTIVVKGDLSAYWRAIGYLNQDPGMSAIIRKLTLSSTTYTVILNNHAYNSYRWQNNVINWDPSAAVSEYPGGGGWRQSPALQLGHELAHAAGPWYAPWQSLNPDSSCDNKEERRVITGPESAAARTLGEDIRPDHRGFLYWVPTPTSR